MEPDEYRQLVCFLSTSSYPEDLQDSTLKGVKNRRDNFKLKANKFFLRDNTVVWCKRNGFPVPMDSRLNDAFTEKKQLFQEVVS